MKTAAEKCAVCGGEFSTNRVYIDGKALHRGCSVMSYPPHRPEDMSLMNDEIEQLRAALKPFADLGYNGVPNQGEIDQAFLVYYGRKHTDPVPHEQKPCTYPNCSCAQTPCDTMRAKLGAAFDAVEQGGAAEPKLIHVGSDGEPHDGPRYKCRRCT